jgi:hypothetical protein
MNIEQVIARHTETLMRLPNVVGVGLGEKHGHAVIKVLVTHKVARADLSPPDLIPARIEGYDTDVEPISILTAQ